MAKDYFYISHAAQDTSKKHEDGSFERNFRSLSNLSSKNTYKSKTPITQSMLIAIRNRSTFTSLAQSNKKR